MRAGLKHRLKAWPMLLMALVSLLCAQTPERAVVGRQADGSVLLPTGWRIQPAGTQVPVGSFPISSAASKDGKFLLVLQGREKPSIVVFELPAMNETARVPIAGAWLRLAFSPDDRFVYVGGGATGLVQEFAWSAGDLRPGRTVNLVATPPLPSATFVGDVAVSPDGRLILAADVFHDTVVEINQQTGRVIERFKTGRRPYRILFHPDGKSFFVTSWAEGAVYQHETANGAELGRLRLGPQTTDMAISDRKLEDDDSGSRYRLYVAAANTNNVFTVGVNNSKDLKSLEVLNIGMVPAQPAGMTPSALALSADQTKLFVTCSDANVVAVVDVSETRSRVEGFIPTGAYPTSVRVLSDGRISVLNGGGTMSVINAPDEGSLADHTVKAMALTPYKAAMADEQAAARSLFEHVVYVVLDGGTYDQTFEPGAAPNYSKLAQEFARFENFYVQGDTPAEGHQWAMAAIATNFTRRLALPALAGEPANLPPAGYLWSNARVAGLTVRNYGEFVENNRATDPSLTAITNLSFQGSDADRARVFTEEWKKLDAAKMLPRLAIVKLGGDDRALGMIAEALSKSSVWPKTALFVASASVTGRDHVDSHRGVLLAISPYTRRGLVDSTFYNQTSVLRTIELILGLRPMTQFDAAARPLTGAFANTEDARPYEPARP